MNRRDCNFKTLQMDVRKLDCLTRNTIKYSKQLCSCYDVKTNSPWMLRLKR